MSSSVLSGRRALITGATDGIGRHTAAGLADRGAHVTIVGRDQVRGRTAAVDITRETGNPEVEFVSADLSTRSGVRALAERIGTGPLDILINNVGGLYMTRWETEDGVEASLAMNALNPLLLTTLLQPALAAAPAARVVYVTGGMPGRIDPAALQSTDKYLGMRTYSHTKSVMMALAYEQAQRWRPTGITVNVAYPGGADTPHDASDDAGRCADADARRVAALQADHGPRQAGARRSGVVHLVQQRRATAQPHHAP